jgi:hypothetical protein
MKLKRFLLRYYPPGIILEYEQQNEVGQSAPSATLATVAARTAARAAARATSRPARCQPLRLAHWPLGNSCAGDPSGVLALTRRR